MRVEIGEGVIWGRFAMILNGLVVKLDALLTAKEGFCARMSGDYFVKCANVRYTPASAILTQTNRSPYGY